MSKIKREPRLPACRRHFERQGSSETRENNIGKKFKRRKVKNIQKKHSIIKTDIDKVLKNTFPDALFKVKKKCASTQAEIKNEDLSSARFPFLMIAEEQKKGVGRFGRKFYSPPGGLWFSFFVPAVLDKLEEDCAIQIAILIKKAIHSKYSCKLKTKEPNDIIDLAGRKLAGIIVTKMYDGEKYTGAIIGIGINVNNDTDFDGVDAVSLRELLGREVLVPEVLELCLQSIAALV